jgi:hypothetical protein
MNVNLAIVKRWVTAWLAALGSAISGTSGAFSTTLQVTGVSTLTGGIAQATAYSGAHNWQPIAATSGTDTFFADGTQYVSSVFLPANMTLTGVKYLVGSVGGTDKAYAVLYSASGAVLANSTLESDGTTVGTAATIQALAFTATYDAVGPAMYYVGISADGNTAKLRTVPAYCGGSLFAGSVSQTHATVAAITEPVTFTADKAPVLSLY